MVTQYFAIILVFSIDDMPKTEEETYKEAFFACFKDDDFREKFDKLTADNAEYSFILGPYSVERRQSTVDMVLSKDKIPSAFIYENIDGKDVVSLVKGDASFLKYFQ